MATEHHGIKEEAKQTHCVEVREAVYRKSVLHSHHTQHAKFECNAIDCIERLQHVMKNYVGLHNSVILPCMMAILVHKWIGACMGKFGTTQPVRSRLAYNMYRVAISNILVR